MSDEAAKRYVISDQPPGNAPRLMLISHKRLSPQAAAILGEDLRLSLESDQPFVIHGGYGVYQLIEGRWIHLDGSIELEDAPIPAKINFREFT